MLRKLTPLLIAAAFVGIGSPADTAPARAAVPTDIVWRLETTTNFDCNSVVYAHPSAGIVSDPCAARVFVATSVSTGEAYARYAQDVQFSWVQNGSDTRIDAVRTVGRFSDLNGSFSSIQVNWINAGYFNGGGIINSCASVCANTSGDDLLAYTPWKFGVGCGNQATGHSAGDRVYNHAQYSSRFWPANVVVTWDLPGDNTTAFPSYYYFAPRSSC